ncbi:MAG: hypothetical protein WCT02_02845 [Candidatus Paceibacterota bacterium]
MDQTELKFAKKIGNWVSAIILGNTRELIARIDERTNQMLVDLNEKIKPDLQNVRERFAALEGSIGKTFASGSPVSLLPKGQQVLKESGLMKYIDENKDALLAKFGSVCPMTNQYDIQEQSFRFFNDLDFGLFEESLKKAAFDFGMDIATVRRIGGIYFRDIALLKAGFKPEDLDGK